MDDRNPPEFLRRLISSRYERPTLPTRPHVTLTFAQSLDAKIAGAQGRQLILSGKDSMVMTHWMRTMHDGILIGIGTALNDDPQLNVRHLQASNASFHHLPRPIIIDTWLRLPPTCKLLQNYKNGVGKRPWVICGAFDVLFSDSTSSGNSVELVRQRRQALEAAGARVFEIPAISYDDRNRARLPISSILHTLKECGISTVMVEGGAQIISSFMAEHVVDTLVITIAPVFVGDAGIGYNYPSPPGSKTEGDKFKYNMTQSVGEDSVVVLCHEVDDQG